MTGVSRHHGVPCNCGYPWNPSDTTALSYPFSLTDYSVKENNGQPIWLLKNGTSSKRNPSPKQRKEGFGAVLSTGRATFYLTWAVECRHSVCIYSRRSDFMPVMSSLSNTSRCIWLWYKRGFRENVECRGFGCRMTQRLYLYLPAVRGGPFQTSRKYYNVAYIKV